MNEQAEFTPTSAPVETESENSSREAANHAAAIIALNESAAYNDLPQENVDLMRSQIDSEFAIPQAEANTLESNDLVGALESANLEAETAEPSHAAALAAVEEEHKRSELMGINEAAVTGDWSQDRIEAAHAELETRYAAK